MTSSSSSVPASLNPPPLLSLQSPELQAEFLKERRNKFQSEGDSSDSGVPGSQSPSQSSSSSSPQSSSPSPSPESRKARLSLSSPELLTELRESSSSSLRHIPKRNGLTTVFSGRGRGGQVSDSTPGKKKAIQRIAR